ncbi:MAG: glycosyltransferase family 9 protein [Smithellaceae bacterium]|jgi:lipopolysaccharide heptosyltransferase II
MLELKSILILRFDHIGDVLLLTPVFRALKQQCPDVKITVAVGSWAKAALDANPDVDDIMIFDHPRFSRHGRLNVAKCLVESIKFLFLIRRKKFDMIIDPRSNLSTLFFTSLSGARYRVGFDHGGRGLFLTTKTEEGIQSHQIDRNLSLLHAIGLQLPSQKKPVFVYSQDDSAWAKGLFARLGLDNPLIVHSSAPWPPRRWPPERFAEIITWFIENFKSKVVLIGSHEDMAISQMTKQMVKQQLRDYVIDLSGKTTLKQTAAVIKLSRIYLGVESAPMHLAVAIGTPVVALMGPGEYPRFAPYGEKDITIRTELKCSPCHQDRNPTLMRCFKGCSACMDQITVEKVKQQILTMLQRDAAR